MMRGARLQAALKSGEFYWKVRILELLLRPAASNNKKRKGNKAAPA